MERIEDKHAVLSKENIKTGLKRMCVLIWLVLIIIGLVVVK
ncbi:MULTISPECIES: hypothetical protein [Lactobacillus]|nr:MULTISPECIES: hypothetical protein [Lactobacillus]